MLFRFPVLAGLTTGLVLPKSDRSPTGENQVIDPGMIFTARFPAAFTGAKFRFRFPADPLRELAGKPPFAGATASKGKKRPLLKKRRKNFCSAGPMAPKPARPR